MTQQQIFKSLEELCRNYESMLIKMDRLGNAHPPGYLAESVRGESCSYSLNLKRNGHHSQVAIPPNTKAGGQLIQLMREKRVIKHGRRVLTTNIQTIRKALKRLQVYDPEQYAGRLMPYDGIALPDRDFLPGQLNVSKWIADTKAGNYKINPFYPEDRKYETQSGVYVRSKSEASWYNTLEEAALLFRYDSAIQLNDGRVIYADFVVLLPEERRLIIIEHFGRMDDPKYAMKNMRRLQDYADSGYVLGRDLFFTLETKSRPLAPSQIRSTLRRIGI